MLVSEIENKFLLTCASKSFCFVLIDKFLFCLLSLSASHIDLVLVMLCMWFLTLIDLCIFGGIMQF